MEVLDSPGSYFIVDKLAIGSEREVFSVYVNYTVPLARIQTVALDPASKTSVELTRLVLEKFPPAQAALRLHRRPADAQLLIGDPAINHRHANPGQNYLDLATAWRQYTACPSSSPCGPCARRSSPGPRCRWPRSRRARCPDLLRRAGRSGITHREALARNPFERQYLTKHLCYDLGAPQKKSHRASSAKCWHNRAASAPGPKVSYL